MPSHPSGPFTAFRIAENRFPLLDGGGAYRFGARWNSSGRHVIYAGLGFAVALIEKNPKPTREEARKALDGNICRCGTYVRVLEAALDPKAVRRG